MADYLAINWDKSKLTGIEAHVGVTSVSIKRTFEITWPDQHRPAQDPVSAGSWLKNELHRLGVSAKQVLISFPRHESTVRLIEIPDVPLDEIPEIVRFQTATKSSVPLGQLMLDYLLMPVQEGKTTREVLVVSIGKDLHDKALKTFQSMGLEVVSTGLSSVSAAEWVAHTTTGDLESPTLILNSTDDYLEMSLIQSRRLLFTNSVPVPIADGNISNQTIQTELKRFLMARSAQLAGQDIGSITLIGDESHLQPLIQDLQEQYLCPVEVLNPLVSVTTAENSETSPLPGTVSGPLGLVYARQHKRLETVDFLHPHKAEEKPDRRKLQIALGVGGLALIVLTAFFLTHQRVSELDEEIAERQKVQRDLDELLKRGQPTLESVAVIEEWEKSNSPTLKVFQELERVLPGTDRIYLSELSVSRSSGQSLSRLRTTGNAKDDLDVRDLNQQLSYNNYRVHPKRSNNLTSDTDYPVPFEIDAERLPSQETPSAKTATEIKK
ncbi:hypothetical protein [Gimesia sp.]|uniref:hypothetical protein n=1 Tax=Gimesia sp. TaxID=2024833 RepID=UPI0032EF6CFE